MMMTEEDEKDGRKGREKKGIDNLNGMKTSKWRYALERWIQDVWRGVKRDI
jgi:hypothetical protein